MQYLNDNGVLLIYDLKRVWWLYWVPKRNLPISPFSISNLGFFIVDKHQPLIYKYSSKIFVIIFAINFAMSSYFWALSTPDIEIYGIFIFTIPLGCFALAILVYGFAIGAQEKLKEIKSEDKSKEDIAIIDFIFGLTFEIMAILLGYFPGVAWTVWILFLVIVIYIFIMYFFTLKKS